MFKSWNLDVWKESDGDGVNVEDTSGPVELVWNWTLNASHLSEELGDYHASRLDPLSLD